jgi:hypothetical protein
MKTTFFICLFFCFWASAQTSKVKILPLTGKGFAIDSLPSNGTKFLSSDFEKMFSKSGKGVLFFYTQADSIDPKRLDYDNQVRTIANDSRFKNGFVRGIPCVRTLNESDNVQFDSFIVTDIQCVIYCADSALMQKTLRDNDVFYVVKEKMPKDYYLIDIDKNTICVKEKRIEFFGKFILELMDPKYSTQEQLEMMRKEMKVMTEDLIAKQKKIDSLEKANKELTERLLKIEEFIKTIKKNK